MIRLRQQTSRDLMLRLTVNECAGLLASLTQLPSRRCALAAELHAPVLKARSPSAIELSIELGSSDELTKAQGRIVWTMERETLDELVARLQRAIAGGSFIPAELMLTKGPRGQWLRLYAELDGAPDAGPARDRR